MKKQKESKQNSTLKNSRIVLTAVGRQYPISRLEIPLYMLMNKEKHGIILEGQSRIKLAGCSAGERRLEKRWAGARGCACRSRREERRFAGAGRKLHAALRRREQP